MYNSEECPYCGEEQKIDHDDGYGYEEDEVYKQECADCEKTFIYTTSISFHYSTEKAECLNGGEHDYRINRNAPYNTARMICTHCDEYK